MGPRNKSLIKPSHYWRNKKELWVTTESHMDELTQEVACLPSVDRMSPFFLTSVLYKISDYHRRLYAFREKSPARNLWYSLRGDWISAAVRRRMDFNAQDLSMAISGFAALQVNPPPYFWEKFHPVMEQRLRETSRGGVSVFDPFFLASMLYGMASLAHVPPSGVSDALATAIDGHLDDFRERASLLTCWSLAVNSVLRPLTRKDTDLARRILNGPAPATSAGQLAYAHASFRLFSDEKLLSDMERRRLYSSSRLSMLVMLLTKAGVNIDQSVYEVGKLNTKIDCAFSVGGRPFFMEIDGPSHFVKEMRSNRHYLSGGTRLMTALIQQQCPDVTLIRVPYWLEETSLRDKHAPERMWNLLNLVAKKYPIGAYQLKRVHSESKELRADKIFCEPRSTTSPAIEDVADRPQRSAGGRMRSVDRPVTSSGPQ